MRDGQEDVKKPSAYVSDKFWRLCYFGYSSCHFWLVAYLLVGDVGWMRVHFIMHLE